MGLISDSIPEEYKEAVKFGCSHCPNTYGCSDVTTCIVYLESMKNKKQRIALTETEKSVLIVIHNEFKWIARNKNGILWGFKFKPKKQAFVWVANDERVNLRLVSDLFQFITWVDEEPYSIEELLKGCD